MKRRKFIQTSALAAIAGTALPGPVLAAEKADWKKVKGKVKNIIFMVSDGMSTGVLNMADLLMQRKEGHGSAWIDLYRKGLASRALMDTSSNNSLVTDSAAASSAWGGGVKVNNSKLNVNPDGSFNKPILQKFKEAGKSVGCVTTVPITHATPAGFCVNTKHRNRQDEIASMYLDLSFDVMMGGGMEYFDGTKRADKQNIFEDFLSKGFQVVKSRDEMSRASSVKPLLGVFHNNGLPYVLDKDSDQEQKSTIPSLAEMTKKAMNILSENKDGFVLQVEGGKVDWAAHANDIPAVLYEQLDFDAAIAEVIAFAENRDDTLVIITTDHGNANPGLIKSDKVDEKFDLLQKVKHTNDWVLYGLSRNNSIQDVVDRLHVAQGITISEDEARIILNGYRHIEETGLYNPYQLPFKTLAEIQFKYFSVGWSGINHSADFVELCMFGAGKEALLPYVKNTDLHYYMLDVTGIDY